MHGHLAESRGEVAFVEEHYGCRPAEWFRRHDLLGDRFYYAHCIHLNDEEVQLMADTNTGISTCPISNMYLSSGSCRIPDLLRAGVKRFGIGVDGAASSNSASMMEEIRVSYLLNRLSWGDDSIGCEDILYLATAGGAAALGRNDIGHLAPGMAADFTLMNWNQLQYAGGCNDPVDCIVLSGDARMIETVVVNGETVVKNGRLTKVNEEEKRDYAAAVEYPDICIITDTKFTDAEVVTAQFTAMLNDAHELGLSYLFDRMVIQVYSPLMFRVVDHLGHFPHYIYTFYAEGFNGTEEALRERLTFCRKNGIEGVTMWSWLWRPSYAVIAENSGVRCYVHTVNDRETAEALLQSGVSAVYTDYLVLHED